MARFRSTGALPALAIPFCAIVALAAPPAERTGEALAGHAAPGFTAARLHGDSLALADLRGRFTLLNFYGPQCPPCVAEAPHLQRLHRKYEKKGLQLVGVTQMNPKRADIEKFLRKKRISYTIVLDPGEAIGKRYGVRAHPTSVLVDPQGVVRWVRAGYLEGDEKEMEAAIVEALGAGR